jgi:hypothetical protein
MKSGLGAMLAEGFEMESAGAFFTGTVVGATVVGVTTVVGGGVVVVGLGEPFEFEPDFFREVVATTCV